jgi:hypothetical protein
MKELSKRANILYRDFNSIPVLIYEDHRFAVNVLYYYYAKTGINNLNAFIFDKHCDLREIDKSSLQKSNQINGFKNLFDFVEYDLSEDDNDWVKSAMELKLIKNYYLFFAQRIKNIQEKKYKDNSRNIHCIDYININNFDALLSNPDLLKEPYFVDFDLDCFSYSSNDKIKAMNLEETKIHINYNKNKSFYEKLISNASFISMCFESDFCGGINESRKIFNNVNKLFFKNKLW